MPKGVDPMVRTTLAAVGDPMTLRNVAISAIGAALLSWFLFAAAIARAADAPDQPRQKTTINAFWKYHQGDASEAQTPAFNDASWQNIGLPHSFSIPYFMSPDFYVGYGWYRKHLQLSDSVAGKRVSLEFDGVFQDSEVFVNGTRVDTHKGGYTGFSLDITGAAKPGDNVIAVRVNNLWNPRLAPRAGEHVFSGGIYRNVFLVITGPLHIDWYGTFVTTPQVSADSALANVKTEVVNDSVNQKSATVRQQILDPDGNVAAEFSATQSIAPGASAKFDMPSPPIRNPRLWHPDHPFLYSLKTTVLEGDRIADEYTTTFGIRTIKWTADQGFFLNGEHLYLRGANVHQDQAGWGDAVTNAAIERDVKMIKDAGFNFIRGSHYPHSPVFSDACDRLGIMFWCENDFWSTATGRQMEGYWNGSGYPTKAEDQPEFEASSRKQLTEMIQIHRNHPSIIVWSMCNEPFFSAGSVMPKVRTFLKDLVDLTHTLDPTRPAALGGVQRPTDTNGRIDKIGDIAGYNGDGASIAAFQNPGIPNMASEYNNVSSDRPGRYEPGWGDLLRTPGIDRNQPYAWRLPWRSGETIWCAFDHGTIASANFGKMGIVDYFRIPKRSWFWYRNEYAHVAPPEWPQSGTPAGLKLETDRKDSVRTDGTDDAWLLVTVTDANGKPLSNTPPVELAIIKGPGEFPTGPAITFDEKSDIRIQDGQAAITFRSYYAGDTVIRAASPGLAPAEITLHFVGSVPYQEGKTPPVQARPYVRFNRAAQPAQPQTFGRNSPTFPSSALPDHPGALADDGDTKTYWQPADNDANPSWTVDTERFVTVSRVRITLARETVCHVKIDVSDDQKTWRPLADLSADDRSSATLEATAPANTSGRFVRLQFQSLPANAPIQLTEVDISGTL
jgi:beta-galactosidase